MECEMKSASAQKAVETTLEIIRKRVSAYDELIERFGPLFLKKAALRDSLAGDALAVPDIEPAKVSVGIPVLAGADLTPWKKELTEVADALFPTLADSLHLDETSRSSLQGFLADPDNILGLAQARIDGNWKHFENTSKQLGITPDHALLYISENVFSPVFSAMAESLGKSLSKLDWEYGYCPVCGSSPSISQLSPIEVTDLDHLVGGGGKKYLHCSLCGHDWRFKRNACPACGNDEAETREIFTMDGVKYERIEACHKCKTYCLSIDMRECQPNPQLDVAQIGLIHLDIYAHENKLQPVTPTLWNTLE